MSTEPVQRACNDPVAEAVMAISLYNAMAMLAGSITDTAFGYETVEDRLCDVQACAQVFEDWTCRHPEFVQVIDDAGWLYRYLLLDRFGKTVLALRPRLLYYKLEDGNRLNDDTCLEVAQALLKHIKLPPLAGADHGA